MRAFLGLALAAALATPTWAAGTMTAAPSVSGPTVLVRDGCGPDYHRNYQGYCVPNWREWQNGWRACPPGWHLGPEGRRCWPN